LSDGANSHDALAAQLTLAPGRWKRSFNTSTTKSKKSARPVSSKLGSHDSHASSLRQDIGQTRPGPATRSQSGRTRVHLAAFCGVPTFAIVGPQLPEWFAPRHPVAEWIEGKACPYKLCSDYCRFPTPHCLWNIGEEEVWPRVEALVKIHLRH
jgi:hypothetical protein